MGYSVSGLSDYVKQDESIASRVVAGAKTIDMLRSAGALVFGKGDVDLTNISQTVVFAERTGCGRTDGAGTTVFAQRRVRFKPITEYTSFCHIDLYHKWLNEKISKGQDGEKLDAEIWNKIVDGRLSLVQAEFDRLLWRGDTSITGTTNNMRFIDGFLKVIGSDGTTITSTGADVIAKLQSFVSQIPAVLKQSDDFKVFISKDAEDAVMLRLFQLNLFNPAQAGTIPGTTVKYEVMDALNGQTKAVAARVSNLRAIVDDTEDTNSVDVFEDKLTKRTYMDFMFGGGVNVTIADETYITSL